MLLALFALGLAVVLATAAYQSTPGYMDADYYFAGGLRLVQGHGLTEPFLWNYLDDPAGLPHPSHAYWMPLASFLAAIGMWLAGASQSFTAGRLVFLFVAACLPPLAASISWSLTARRGHAWLAGLLAVFPAFYLPFLPVTDTFGLYMLLGGLFLLLARRPLGSPAAFALGLIAGLMHLARADGLMWLPLALLAAWLLATRRMPALLLVVAGYAIVMGPWMGRNLVVFGSPLAPGGAGALWLTRYDQVFAYPASQISFAAWLQSGIGPIISVRLDALLSNLLTAWIVQGGIIQLPFVIVGALRLRSDPRVLLAAPAWFLTLVAMSFAFPFAGARGGFFHSGAALQLFWYALVPVGLDDLLARAARRWKWDAARSGLVFAAVLVAVATLASAYLLSSRVIGKWDRSQAEFRHVEFLLAVLEQPGERLVMIDNPPGYFIATGDSAISVPDGDLQTVLAVAKRYGATHLVLQDDSLPVGLVDVYRSPDQQPGLIYLEVNDLAGIRIFRIP